VLLLEGLGKALKELKLLFLFALGRSVWTLSKVGVVSNFSIKGADYLVSKISTGSLSLGNLNFRLTSEEANLVSISF
jgi:hypothetical protein